MDVSSGGAVAAFAGNSKDKISFVVVIVGGGGSGLFEIGGVAFEAAWRDGAIEVGGAVDVAGAVDPVAESGPVGNREFEESVFFPIKIGLAFGGGADDEIDGLGAFGGVAGLLADGGFEEVAVAGFHVEGEFGI